jgi:hypothetical protein
VGREEQNKAQVELEIAKLATELAQAKDALAAAVVRTPSAAS